MRIANNSLPLSYASNQTRQRNDNVNFGASLEVEIPEYLNNTLIKRNTPPLRNLAEIVAPLNEKDRLVIRVKENFEATIEYVFEKMKDINTIKKNHPELELPSTNTINLGTASYEEMRNKPTILQTLLQPVYDVHKKIAMYSQPPQNSAVKDAAKRFEKGAYIIAEDPVPKVIEQTQKKHKKTEYIIAGNTPSSIENPANGRKIPTDPDKIKWVDLSKPGHKRYGTPHAPYTEAGINLDEALTGEGVDLLENTPQPLKRGFYGPLSSKKQKGDWE